MVMEKGIFQNFKKVYHKRDHRKNLISIFIIIKTGSPKFSRIKINFVDTDIIYD